MIEIGKKYRLKKLKGWFEKDSEEFTVRCIMQFNKIIISLEFILRFLPELKPLMNNI